MILSMRWLGGALHTEISVPMWTRGFCYSFLCHSANGKMIATAWTGPTLSPLALSPFASNHQLEYYVALDRVL